MRGTINDSLRWLIGRCIVWLGAMLAIVQRVRIRSFSRDQNLLARRYRITSETPILTFGPALEQSIDAALSRLGSRGSFAFTSGSTASPKRILYSRRRLRAVKAVFSDAYARACFSMGIRRTSLYVFGSFDKDHSLTSMLLDEPRLPPYLSSLQAPYRIQWHPAIQSLLPRYGSTAVRLWVIAMANPGVLYSTNPSTLSTFLDDLARDWQSSSRLVRDWCNTPQTFDRELRRIARRIESRGSASRLRRLSESESSLPMTICAPGVSSYMCWTGGYVRPFLERIAKHLHPDVYRLIPMYSMSTETIETVSHYVAGTVSFLPLAPGVLYEFLDDRAADEPRNLLTAPQLQEGKLYSLIASDPFGLRRYQTGDVFRCRGKVRGLPDLQFECRRDLEYSFTGEKLTASQVSIVLDELRCEFPALGYDRFVTVIPSHPESDCIPHYKLVVVQSECAGKLDGIEERCDELLMEINCEYRSKRGSGRLGCVTFANVAAGEFILRMGGACRVDSGTAQFKFLPLYQSTWESRAESCAEC